MIYSTRLFARAHVFAALAIALMLCFDALAQTPKNAGAVRPADQKPEPGKWRLTASKGTPRTFTLRANDAKLSEVAQDFSQKIKVPFIVSPSLSTSVVNVEVSNMALEQTLRLLSPKVYIDYELVGESAQPKPLAVYLNGLNDQPPGQSAVINSGSEAMLIEGDTEEGTEEYEERKEKEGQQLKVTYTFNQLSVLARKQPLSLVVYKIASEVGVPFDLKYDSPEVVNIDFKNYPLDHAIRNLGPNVRFFYRADLQTGDVMPLRLALDPPMSVNPNAKP